MSTSDYAFADRAHEQRRLASQAEEFEPLTERLFRAAGLVPGMRVLDLGSGAGDVAILAARLVAREGEVVGVERVRPRWHRLRPALRRAVLPTCALYKGMRRHSMVSPTSLMLLSADLFLCISPILLQRSGALPCWFIDSSALEPLSSTLCSRSALAAARNAPQPPAGGEYGAKTGGSEASSSVMVETFQTKNLMVAPRTRDRVTKLIPFPANGRRTLRRKEPPAPPRSG
jgi:hypothetical protein